jgi:hypothetical protein
MSNKVHLALSPDPKTFSGKELALCGAVIPNAVVVFMWDDSAADTSSFFESVNRITTCAKCVNQIESEGRYVYGIRSGEEVKQELCDVA